jgi:hypothetical protein
MKKLNKTSKASSTSLLFKKANRIVMMGQSNFPRIHED